MFLAIKREGQVVSRMQEVNGEQQERVLAVDEYGNESWVPPERLTSNAAATGRPERAAGSVARVLQQGQRPETTQGASRGQGRILNVVLQEESSGQQEEEEEEEAFIVLGKVQPAGQAAKGFWATNVGAVAAFFGLWAGAGVLGHYCGYMGPNAMVVGYLVGVIGWIGGYVWFLKGWYRSQPWQIVKAVVEVPSVDSKGRQKVDRQGRVVVREEERAVAKRVGGRVYIKAWRPFREQWVPAEVLGISIEEISAI